MDNIESKVESLNTKLNVSKKSVASLKFEMGALKEKQNMMEQSLEDFKASVDFNNTRVDPIELKSIKFETVLAEAKEDLKRRSLYLEAYCRRENLKFAGITIPESEGD